MSDLLLSDDFKSIVLGATPLIDVRAPAEFKKGAFPNSINLPLMNDEERHLVGICYKEYGNDEALKLGHTLVGGKSKKSAPRLGRILYARIPMRCSTASEEVSAHKFHKSGWQKRADKSSDSGGYKAFRRYLIGETERSCDRFSPILLGGRTGSGKTILLQRIDNRIDLEALANHRGSSFGRHITPQTSQIDFENALGYALIQKLELGFGNLVFEDEGRNIGKVYLPTHFAEYLSHAPLIILETPMHERVEIIFEEYVVHAQELYRKSGHYDPLDEWQRDMRYAMERIQKRLGGLRYHTLCKHFENAASLQIKSEIRDAHKTWIEYLLKEYYDPMYDYQIQKRSDKIVFRGNEEEVLAYLKESGSL